MRGCFLCVGAVEHYSILFELKMANDILLALSTSISGMVPLVEDQVKL